MAQEFHGKGESQANLKKKCRTFLSNPGTLKLELSPGVLSCVPKISAPVRKVCAPVTEVRAPVTEVRASVWKVP
ncbi:MAG: hypothetical protein LBH04_04205 [Tannerellaceae bacterium]|nr:hypothetical protein [Tannerellaceae bacterium]